MKSHHRLFSVRLPLLLLISICTLPKASYSIPPPFAEFRIGKRSLIYVPIVVNGAPRTRYPFAFHTGSPGHVIDIRLRSFGKEIHDGMNEPGPSVQANTMRLMDHGEPTKRGISLSVGNLTLGGRRVVYVQDLGLLEKETGEACFGIVGAPFLIEHFVELDFDKHSLRVRARDDLTKVGWTACKMTIGSLGRPWCCGVRLGQRTESFLVDTGSNGSIEVHKWLFDSLVRSGYVTAVRKAFVTTQQGHDTRRAGRLTELVLGPFRHRNLDIVEAKENRLGLDYLRRYSIILDLSGERMFLRKSKSYNKSDLLNETGICVLKSDDRVVIDDVSPDSIAEKHGVRKNDQLVTMNGRAVAQMSLYDIRRVLREAHGKRVTLSLKRKGSIVKTAFSVPVDSTLAKESGNKEKNPGVGDR